MAQNDDNTIKVGVFGVGSLGQWHARIYSELADAELVGVHDVDADRAREVAERYGTRAFADARELGEAVEAASLVVPTDRHFDVFNTLIDTGIHMLVEKPIAADTEEAEAMVRAAQERGILLQVGHVERFNPVMRFLETELTRPRFIEAIRLSPFPPPREGAAPRGTEVSVVLDLMIHDLEIILHLVNATPNDIHAVGVPVLSSGEDIANVRLTFPGGCVANVTASRISRERMRKLRFFQADGYLSVDLLAGKVEFIRKRGDFDRRLVAAVAGGMAEVQLEDFVEAVPVEVSPGEPLRLELEAFTTAVSGGGTVPVTGEDGLRALRVAVQILERMQRVG